MKIYNIIFLLVLIFVVSCFSVSAISIQIPVPINVNFETEHNFKLEFPGGFERTFSWDNGTRHSDEDFTYYHYYTIDANEWCKTNSNLGEYKTVADTMGTLTTSCNTMVTTMSDYKDLLTQKAASDLAKIECEKTQEFLNINLQREINKSTTFDSLRLERDSLASRISSLQQAQTDLGTCNANLNTAQSAKNNWGMGGLIIGFALAWFIWGKKKLTGPSEQRDFGMSGDQVHYPGDDTTNPDDRNQYQ